MSDNLPFHTCHCEVEKTDMIEMEWCVLDLIKTVPSELEKESISHCELSVNVWWMSAVDVDGIS